MAITPGPGYMIDPNNPNAVVPIGSQGSINNPNANIIAPGSAPYQTPSAPSNNVAPTAPTAPGIPGAAPVVQTIPTIQAPAQSGPTSSGGFNVTPVGGNGSQMAPNLVPTSQIAGYSLPSSGNVSINGQSYEIVQGGAYLRPIPAGAIGYNIGTDISAYSNTKPAAQSASQPPIGNTTALPGTTPTGTPAAQTLTSTGSTQAPTTAGAAAGAPINYNKLPTETIDQYNARIAASGGPVTQTGTSTGAANSIDTNYQIQPGESTQAYNARIAQYNASKPITQVSGQPGSSGQMAQMSAVTGQDSYAGLDPIAKQVKMYTDAYKALGLSTIKDQYDSYVKEQKDLTDKMNDEIADTRNNPWLSQGVADKTVERIKAKYETRLNTLTNLLTLTDSIYKQGQAQVDHLVSDANADIKATNDLAQKQIDAANALAKDNQIVEIGGREVLVNKQTGKQITDLGAAQASGSIGEYQYAVSKGYTGSYTQYQNEDANRKISIAKAGVGGTSNQTIDNERALLNQFNSEPIVKDYNTILAKKLSVDQILSQPLGGPGDLAVVYEFMKGLDPTSVVRETEYASAAASGNIFAGVLARFNGYLSPNGGFLPPQVKSAFQSIVDSKLKVQSQLYNNVASQYQGIAKTQGLNPNNVIINYSAGASNTPSGPSGSFDSTSAQSKYNY